MVAVVYWFSVKRRWTWLVGASGLSQIDDATNSMVIATCFKNGTGTASRYLTACTWAGQLSLIIPNASTHGPPTSSAVLVNLGVVSLFTESSCQPSEKRDRASSHWDLSQTAGLLVNALDLIQLPDRPRTMAHFIATRTGTLIDRVQP